MSPLRRSLLVLALAAGTLLASVHAAAPASTVSAAASARAVVGEVTALGGSKRLTVKSSTGGAARRLKKGDKLRLGDHVTMGARVKATLKLTRPKSVDSDTELIDLVPASGAHHNVTISRSGTRTTLTITPAP